MTKAAHKTTPVGADDHIRPPGRQNTPSKHLTYTYDGTLEGYLTCVFDSYARHEAPDEIAPEAGLQLRLDQHIRPVPTDEAKWQRVQAGIIQTLGDLGWIKVRACFLSSVAGKDDTILRYLRHGFPIGRRVHADLSHPCVAPLEALYTDMAREVERMKQFARFAQTTEGLYFATINPKHSVIPLIMDHFAGRFNVQSFIIYDEVHNLAGLCEQGSWYLAPTQDFHPPDTTSDEQHYQKLWKTFYDAVAIPQRKNHKLRRQFMPQRLWKNITELQ